MIRRLILLLAALAGALFASPAAAMPAGAAKLTLGFDGLIADDAGVLPADFKEEMQARLTRLRERAGVSVVLVTAPGLQGADSGKVASSVGKKLHELGRIDRHWIVFLLVPADRVFSASLSIGDMAAAEAVRGMDEEGKREIGRAFAALFAEAVTPHFKANQWQAGMRAGVEALEGYLQGRDTADPSETGEGPADS